MTARVQNIRTDFPDIGAIRCDRQTPYGNPFVMKGKSDAERNRVCDAFEEWAPKQPGYAEKLSALRGHSLLCWCAPKRCHCDFWLREANK